MATTAETKQFIRQVRIEQDRRNALKFETIANLADFKTKLNGIEAGAQVNVIESISIDGTNQTVAGKAVALDLSDYAKKSDVAASVTVKGSVANFAALPANAEVGDMYHVTAAGGTDENGVAIKAGDNVVKTETGWDNFGGTIDLSNYVTKDGTKQLSTEDYTTAEKTKLAGVETGAQVNIIETVKVDGTALTPDANKAVNVDLSGKVDKVAGKQLSTNDFTDAYKQKVDDLDTALNTDFTEADLTYIFADEV